ncbi:YolD-like family protein [Ruminococcaceae bacterium OttesenSCG-928-A11]|nr:YolD-like family protein [Ruminococcaceae bacterium OttesenSCG-928-A11]
MTGPYDDIINLPHHESPTRPRMPRENRAAQFSPFAAVVGHDAAIKETGRLTDKRIELGESSIAELDMKLLMLADLIDEHPEISITYFLPDEKKEGGAYVTVTGAVKKIDDVQRVILFMDGKSIAITDIMEIECERFGEHS